MGQLVAGSDMADVAVDVSECQYSVYLTELGHLLKDAH